MKVLVTGSRDYVDELGSADRYIKMVMAITHELRKYYEAHDFNPPAPMVLIHGGARGADMMADEIGHLLGSLVEVKRMNADWERWGRWHAGRIRNQEMIDEKPDVCLAFPVGKANGTHDCMRRAKDAGIPVIVYE